MYREPGSVRKFKPNMTYPTADEAPQKVFLDNETEVLERLADGAIMFVLLKNPNAIWLSKPGMQGFNPNVTIGLYKRFKLLGYIEHVRDEFPHGLWSMSKHGMKAYETLIRKSGVGSTIMKEVLEEKAEKVAKVVAETKAHQEAPHQPSVGEQLKNVVPAITANVLRLQTGGYMLAVELPDYPAVIKAAALLQVDLPKPEVPKNASAPAARKPHEPKIVSCDFCGDEFMVKLLRLKIWKRHCEKNECRLSYVRAYDNFSRTFKRGPRASDRETS